MRLAEANTNLSLARLARLARLPRQGSGAWQVALTPWLAVASRPASRLGKVRTSCAGAQWDLIEGTLVQA